MTDDGGLDDHRGRASSGRGVKSPDRAKSPTHRARRHSRDHSKSRHPRHSHKSESGSHRRHRSRNRDRDRERDQPGHSSPDASRRTAAGDDLIPRFRKKQSRRSESRDSRPRQRSRSRERASHRSHRADPASPSSSKRHRSRSRSFDEPHRKRSRKDHSPSTRRTDSSIDRYSRDRRRHASPGHREPRSSRNDRSDKSPSGSEAHHPRTKHHRSISRSPTRSETGSVRHSNDANHSRRDRRRRSIDSQSPHRDSKPPSRLSELNPSNESSHTNSRSTSRDHPPRSPRSRRDRGGRGASAEQTSMTGPPVEDDMASRSGYRGDYGPAYSHNSHYGHEPRGYPRSPRHHYHDSPSQSPYGTGRSSRNGPPHSPPHQYHPSHPLGGPGYGSGPPPPHYPPNSSHSPPYSAPSGPSNPYSQGNYRGPPRGPGFRGASFANRGSQRGTTFNPSHTNSTDRAPSPRGMHPEDAMNSARPHGSGEADPDRSPPRGPKEPRRDGPPRDETAPTGNRQPPTGPSSGKFSFAFKPSSKPSTAAPKPEISQKFNAAPQRRDNALQDEPDRQPPRSAPTEPASARFRNEPRAPPEGPKMAPRMRKVKKIMKRPKPRPCLPEDLVGSDSVFYRKPGNESVVGSGTYGKVFKGLNVYTKGLVALKRIRMEGERDGFPVTAVREIKLLQSLRHTNIVNLQEVMVEKNDCFMVFEYLSHDLTGLLNHPSFKLEAAQKKHLAKQLFEALDYLHVRGVLHRDLKAANILVSNEGILKLADFGLARFYAKRHQLDYTNRVITIWYRSPELLLGETQYTAAVDVWSAACVMVEIFSRHAIFPGDGTELSQIEKIYNTLGTPNKQDWPGLVDMAWFELLRPAVKRKSLFAEKYRDVTTPASFELLEAMFQYDPAKRPTAADVLQHPYFTTEEPLPKQATELADIGGDWHEFESKALRKENERRDREARRAAAASKEGSSRDRDRDKKRAIEGAAAQRGAKRVHVGDSERANPADVTA